MDRNFVRISMLVAAALFGVGHSQYPSPDNIAYKKTCLATNTINANLVAKNAVDGIRNGVISDTGKGSCFVSKKGNPAEVWAVDLGGTYDVATVIFANREDKTKFANQFRVAVTNEFDVDFIWRSNYTLCHEQPQTSSIKPREVVEFTCIQKAVGRYVAIIKQPAKFAELGVCEVEVYDKNHLSNIALGKHTTSSTNELDPKYGQKYTSPRGNDGHYTYEQPFRTMKNPPDQKQWWRVDLGNLYLVRQITVYTADCCDGEFIQVQFLVAKTFRDNNYESNTFTMCHHQKSEIPPKSSVKVFCRRRTLGRFVVLTKLTAKSSQFSFAEAEVYAHQPEDNYASGKVALQSDEVGKDDIITTSGRAIDGDISDTWDSNSCIETPGKSNREWWSVDLLGLYAVRNLIIKARSDAKTANLLKDFKVLVATDFNPAKFSSNDFYECYKQVEAIPDGHIKPLYCTTALQGRFIIIVKEPALGQPLTFCEVEVYGAPFTGNLAYGKRTKQRSTYWKYSSELAVDGDQETTCSETVPVTPGAGDCWWYVNLGAVYDVNKMVIVNKRDCKNMCLKNFFVYVARTLEEKTIEDVSKYELCHEQREALGSGQRFFLRCVKSILGQYVVIISSGDMPLIICEVEIYETVAWENLAIAKPTSQSSDWKPTEGGAELATDGWKNTDYYMNSCTMTSGKEEVEWWSVDLTQPYRVRRILLVNREDCCEFRLADFKVMVAPNFSGTLGSSDVTMCYSQEHSLGPGEIKDVRCNQVTIGQHIIITKNNPKLSPLTLCEVEIYGSVPRNNLALMRPTLQSGEVSSALTASLSGRAVDGNSDNNINGGSCSQTPGREEREWWMVRLDKLYLVTSVILYNRGDCCGNALQNFRVLVAEEFANEDFANTPYFACYDEKLAMNTGEIKEIGCQVLGIGRYVIVDKNPARLDPLIICEIEVYGRIATEDDYPYDHTDKKKVWTYPTTDNTNNTIDGDFNPNCESKCVVTSGQNDYEWWTVDLEWNHIIEKLRIVAGVNFTNIHIVATSVKFTALQVENHFQSYLDEIRADETAVDDGNSTSNGTADPTTTLAPSDIFRECAVLSGEAAYGEIIEIPCHLGVNGKYVTIMKLGATEQPLKLVEVQVFGTVNDTVPTTDAPITTTTPIPTDPPTEPPTPLTIFVYPDNYKPYVAGTVGAACLGATAGAAIFLWYKLKETAVDASKNN